MNAGTQTATLAARVAARLAQRRWVHGATAGVIVASVLLWRHLVFVPLEATADSRAARMATDLLLALACVLLGGAIAWWRTRHRAHRARHEAADLLEQRVPASRNLLRTALELPDAANPAVAALVQARADALAATVSLPAVAPWAPAVRPLVGAVVVWALSAVLAPAVGAGAAARTAQRAVAAVTQRVTISRVDVAVTPPAYVQRAPTAVRDPQRVEALEGSVLTLTVASNADSLRIDTADGSETLTRPATGDFRWQHAVRGDGFVAITPLAREAGARRLVALAMQRDDAPQVRISAPGADLIVPTANRTLDVRIEARDDVGLRSLQLLYTKVSGSGERFEFTEGRIPVQLQRDSASHWTARAALALAPLLLEPGDVVVYRARVTDGRPGRDAVESDAFLAQLAEPGGVAALGFSMDPDEDRYAVSQQMVIQRTQQLIAAQRTLAPDTVRERAAQIAVEQRRVRAEFVFMTGGEFEAGMVENEEGIAELDEHAEADAEQDLAAGRMVNKGRQALLTAIRAMSRASLALTEQRLTDALRLEKVALTNLLEAFARQRFLMRALSQREALDPARRHSGVFDSVARATVPVPASEPDAAREALQAVLAALVEARASGVGRAANRAPREDDAALALRVLHTDARRREAQQIAQWLTEAATAPAARAGALRDSAAMALTVWLTDARRPAAAPLPPSLATQRRVLRGGSRP